MKQYLVTVKLRLTAIDDVQARERAQKFLKFHSVDQLDAKLQRIHAHKQPERVQL